MHAQILRTVIFIAIAFGAGLWLGPGERSRGPSGPAPIPARGENSAGTASLTAVQTAPDAEGRARRPDAVESAGTPLLTAIRQRDFHRRKHDLYEVVLGLDADGVRLAMEDANRMSVYDRDWAQPALIARWLELDPPGALAWVRALPAGNQRNFLLREYFESCGLKDPAAGLDALKEFMKGPDRGRENLAYAFFTGWAAHDPIGAARAALRLENKDARSSGLHRALGRWAQKDPLGALAFAAQLPKDAGGSGLASPIYSAWAEENAGEALNHALTLPEGAGRSAAFSAVLTGAAARDADAALEFAGQIPEGLERVRAINSLIGQMSHRQPKLAAGLLLSLPAAQQADHVYQVANYLAKEDVAAAMEWASRLSSDEARRRAATQIIREMGQEDPKGALAFMEAQGIEVQNSEWTAPLGEWTRRSPDEALVWAQQRPDEKMRVRAVTSVLETLVRSDPARAIQLAGETLQGRDRANAFRNVAGSWAGEDADAAAAWAARLSDSSERAAAFGGVAARWASEQPAAAAAWLDRLPAGNARDNAVSSFGRTVVRTDPVAAAEWLSTISDANKRQSSIQQIIYEWGRVDRAGAERWVKASAAIDDNARQNILRSLEQQQW